MAASQAAGDRHRRKRNRNKPNPTGRNPHSRFVRLDYRVLSSLAYRSLSPNARALLVELTMLHNGDNNGSIYLALRDAAARMGVADPHTASAAFDELQDRGFIKLTRDAHFSVKAADSSRARTWRLNHIPGPGRRIADWQFLDVQPPAKSRANKRADSGCRALKRYRKARDAEQFPGVEFSHAEPDLADAMPDPMGNFHTGATENRGSATSAAMGNSHTYIANQGVTGAKLTGANDTSNKPENDGVPIPPVGWWQPDHSESVARLSYAVKLAGQLGEAIRSKKLAA